jgi:hypothetical protein
MFSSFRSVILRINDNLGFKRPGREADHSPPSSVEVKNALNFTSAPPYTFMA